MNKVRFVLSAAMVLSIAFLLSCTKIDEAVQQSQCASNQGEWDADAKMCVKCPSGTYMSDGQCVATTPPTVVVVDSTTGATKTVCPPKTKLNESGNACVADIVAVDPNAASGKYYCDYGKLDPLAVDSHDDCVEIEYQSECDKDWGKLVKSCEDKDRRNDLKYCDYGPPDQWGGGCYLILNNNDCDTQYGIVASVCGTHGKYPNGTVCPAGKVKVGNECRNNDVGIIDGTATHCDWGAPHIENGEVQGDCWPINDAETRQNCLQWGKGVKTCPTYACPAGTARPSPGAACAIGTTPTPTPPTPPTPGVKYCFWGKASECWPIEGYDDIKTDADCEERGGMAVASCSNVTWSFCDWGQPVLTAAGGVERGCWAIRTTEQRQICQRDGRIVSSCPEYTCPAGTKPATDYGWGNSGCEIKQDFVPSSSSITHSSSSSSDPSSGTSLYCDYGYVSSTNAELQLSDGGGCFEIGTESECDFEWGKLVNSCNAADRRKDLEFCDYGPWNQWGGGCWRINSQQERNSCIDGKIVKKCDWLNP